MASWSGDKLERAVGFPLSRRRRRPLLRALLDRWAWLLLASGILAGYAVVLLAWVRVAR